MKRTLSIFCFLLLTAAAAVSAQDTTKTPPAEAPKTPPAEAPKTPPAETNSKTESPFLAEWAITISAPGQDLAGTLKLEKDGETIKGVVSTMMGDAPVKNVKIEGDSFTGDMSANVQGQTFEGTINGKLKEGKLTGEINLGGLGAIPYEGTKTEKK